MVNLEAQPTTESLQGLSDAVKRLQEQTGRSASDAVTFAAVKVAQSGRAASKLGRRNRQSIDNPEYRQARGSFAWARKQQRMGKEIPHEAERALADLNSITPYLIVKKRQQQPDLMLPSWEKKDPRRRIEDFTPGRLGGRGLAKKTFDIMAAKAAAMKGKDGAHTAGKGYRVGKYREKYGDTAGSIVARLINRLTYLEDAYPGITQTAISKGTAALVGQMDRSIKRDIARMNR